MKNYEIIWAETDQALIVAVNEHLKKNPSAFCLGGVLAVDVGASPSPHTKEVSGWYQAVAEN